MCSCCGPAIPLRWLVLLMILLWLDERTRMRPPATQVDRSMNHGDPNGTA